MDEQETQLGDYIRGLREAKSLSLRKAARIVGVSHSHLAAIEQQRHWLTGKAHRPTYSALVRIAKAYGVPSDCLLTMAGYEPGAELAVDEAELLREFRKLTQVEQQKLIEIAKEMATEDGV